MIPQPNAIPINPEHSTFLVTGGAGFIGGHLVRRLLAAGGRVRVLDAFTTGRRDNLADISEHIELIAGDIGDTAIVQRAMHGIDYVFHLAALVSVPESVEYPERNLAANIVGTHNLLLAAHSASVRRFVFSSSCAVYGDHPAPHHEALAPRALSPYAAAKLSGEQLCRSFTHVYGLPTVCLRYFNVFGPRQNPRGGYAAAIPQFITALLEGTPPRIYGDGHQTRDFVYVANVVDANLLACASEAAIGDILNIGTGQETSLLDLLDLLGEHLHRTIEPTFAPARTGDIRRSYSDIRHATATLNYRPTIGLADGLRETLAWYQTQALPQ